MRVLVTGNQGFIGSYVEGELRAAGHTVVGFDVRSGDDIRDPDAVLGAVAGCDAVIHLAAQLPLEGFDPNELMATNMLGTWHVLAAARQRRVQRVVYFSSVNALGVFLGHRQPDFLPIDDTHPTYARHPYSLSKRLSEELCGAFTDETGIPTICLRLPKVLAPGQYAELWAQWAEDPESEWRPYWEYGAFLDVRDAATAARLALSCADPGHVTLLLNADDVAASAPSLEMVRRRLPAVEWRGGVAYNREPCRSLVSSGRARALLGWRPHHRWAAHVAELAGSDPSSR